MRRNLWKILPKVLNTPKIFNVYFVGIAEVSERPILGDLSHTVKSHFAITEADFELHRRFKRLLWEQISNTFNCL